jgi:hypothetical protein
MSRAFVGADEAGVPDLAQVDAHLGDFAAVVKGWHAGGEAQWKALVNQTASMWLDYQGLTAAEIASIREPALVFAGGRDEQEGRLDLAVSLYRSLPRGELGICPSADHFGPITPQRADLHAAMTRDFAQRHSGDQ